MTIDLISGTVNLVDPGSDSDSDRADMIHLTGLPQWASYRSWMLRQAVDLYRGAGNAGKEEAYLLARLATFIVDTIHTMDTFSPVMEEKKEDDPYGDGELRTVLTPGVQDLPLAPSE